jgi:hypothetical protein
VYAIIFTAERPIMDTVKSEFDPANYTLRQLQLEAARVISTMPATNANIYIFNKESRHNSQGWYIAAITWYIKEYGGLPSQAGPGKDIKFVYEQET